MKLLNGYRMRLMLVGFVATIVFGGGRAKADFTIGEPTNLGPTVNTSHGEGASSTSIDGLEMYLSTEGPGGYGGGDLWVMTRVTNDGPWSNLVNLGPTVNSSAMEYDPSISADGLSLYFGSNRPGGNGNYDLWMSTRTTTKDDWSAPVNLGPTVNSSADELFPRISADGLQLYFSEWHVARPGGYGRADLWVTTRPTKNDSWGTPVNLGATVNSSYYEAGPLISADGLTLYFSSLRPGGVGGEDIWVTRRATVSDPWVPPVNLGPPINSLAHDALPNLSADGSTFYFGSNRPGGSGGWDLWQSPIIPIVDFNGDGIVDSADMCIMVDDWGTNEPLCDIGPMPWGDGIVDVEDLKVLAEYLFGDMRCVVHFKLDEAKGSIANDSAKNRDGTIHGGPEWRPAGGVVGGALQLDGFDDYVKTGFVLNPADGALSVFAWIKGGAPGQVVISQEGGTDWLMTDAEGNLMTELKGSGRSGKPLQSQTIITDGNWHRIGLVWDGSLRTLYVDSVAVAQDTQPDLGGSDGGLYIGTDKAMESGTYWSGLIDDIRVYNRAVSP